AGRAAASSRIAASAPAPCSGSAPPSASAVAKVLGPATWSVSSAARYVSASRNASRSASTTSSRSARGSLVPNVHDLDLGKELERGGPALAIAEARVLHAAERHVGLAAERWQVDVEHAGVGCIRVPECRVEVSRIDGRREA